MVKMPRCGRIRSFIREYEESARVEKVSFIPPFIILALEIILIVHAYFLKEFFVFILTLILLTISIIEMLLVSFEIHEHYKRSTFDRTLTIRLDDFVIECKEKNVKKIVTDFIEKYPDYASHRNEIYHTACQILETHREVAIEKELSINLEKFIKRRKKANVDDIVKLFVKKFPKYKAHIAEVYEKTCKIMGKNNNKS